jgi:formamidopyrimidine-DNA glycosylase
MPELPEVEVVRRGLDRWVTGRRIAHTEVLLPRSVRRHVEGPHDFAGRLQGRTVTAVQRRGKFLWFELDDDDALIGHLGMSGQLLMQPADEADEKHLRVRIGFDDDGRELRFVDQRTFGGMLVEPLADDVNGGHVPLSVRHIALDPLDERFEVEAMATALRRKRTGLKRALLDQTLVSGIGNIYADEALWRSRLHYARATDSLPRPQIRTLIAHVQDVMNEALAQGGTSFDALYVDVNGSSGYFDRSLNAYGQEGEPCPRCARPIVREPFMNRSSFRCPRCQRVPRAVHW